MPENPILTQELVDRIARDVARRMRGAGAPGPEAAGAASGLPQIERMEPPPGIASPPSGARAAGAVLAVPDSQRELFAAAGVVRTPRRSRVGRERAPAAPQPEPPERPERPASAPYAPQDSKEDALWFVESYRRMLADLRIRVEELEEDLRPYLALSAKKRQKAEAYAQYEQLVGKLGAIDAQAALGLPDLSDSLRATLEALRSEGLDELTRARQNMEAAKSDAARLGASVEEIEPAAPSAQEVRPGLVEPPPTREAGQSEEEYLEKWKLWKDALKSGAWAVPKIAWGVASTLLGVRLAQTGLQFGLERWGRRKEKKAFSEMAQELKALLQEGARAPEAEQEEVFGELIQKMQALEERLDALVEEKKLKPEDREQVLIQVREAIGRAQRQEQTAQTALNQEVERTLHDYFQTKVSKIELGKQTLNTGFLLAEVQIARALGYGAFVALDRAVRARKEHEERLRIEGRPADFWERERAVWQSLVPQAAAEYARGVTGIWGDLFAGRRVSRTEWARKKMEFGKALSTTFIFAGMAKVAHAEITETGYSVEAQIDRLFETIAKRGGLGGAVGYNFLHNIDQLSFGLTRFSQDGELKVAGEPDQGVAKAPEAAAAPVAPEAPEIAKTPEQIAYENALQRLESSSAGKVDFDPDTGRVEITLGKGGYAHIQQALRDIAVLEKMTAGKEFSTVDAAQVENVVANLKYLLEGKDLRFIDAERLDGIAHVGAGKLIIHDVVKFHEIMQGELLTHAAGKINAATLERYDEAVATVNNTSEANWQRDVNVGTGVEDVKGAGYVKVDIDQEIVHQAEIAVAKYEGEVGLGIHGAEVVAAEVVDEDTYSIHVDKAVIPVEDGKVDHVIVERDGQPFSYKIASPIDMSHPYAGGDIIEALAAARQATETTGAGAAPESASAAEVAAAPRATAVLEAPEARTPADLARPVSEGGLVGADGRLHFGALEIEVGWYEKWDDQTVERFVKDAPGKYDPYRWFSDEADAHFKLARAMDEHEAPERMEVGKWILENYKKIGEWVR